MRHRNVSVHRPTRFILIKSNGPRRNRLQPRLLSHFNVRTRVHAIHSPRLQIRVIRRQSRFSRRPTSCLAGCRTRRRTLRTGLMRTRHQLPSITVRCRSQIQVSRIYSRLSISKLQNSVIAGQTTGTVTTCRNHARIALSSVQQMVILYLHRQLQGSPLRDVSSNCGIRGMFYRIFNLTSPSRTLSGNHRPIKTQ